MSQVPIKIFGGRASEHLIAKAMHFREHSNPKHPEAQDLKGTLDFNRQKIIIISLTPKSIIW